MRVEKMRVQWCGGQQALWMARIGCKKGQTQRKRSRGKGQFELRCFFVLFFFPPSMRYAVLAPLNISPVHFFLNIFLPKKGHQALHIKAGLDPCDSWPWRSLLLLPSHFHPKSVAYTFWPCTSLLQPQWASEKRGSSAMCWSEVRSSDCVRAELSALKTGWSSRSQRSFQRSREMALASLTHPFQLHHPHAPLLYLYTSRTLDPSKQAAP